MYDALGLLIRERREALGLDQAVLAARLAVGQQAVSGWERGRSRPRRAMLSELAHVLAVEEGALLDAGEYRSPSPAVRLPVRPLTRALPLEELTEERFEDLLAELMTVLHPDGHASRYGGRGHKQHGIDILVTAGGMNLATGQCKRHREFGPAAVCKAIMEVTIAAPKNYLFLARITATPTARKEAGKYSSWELWDGEDISRYIRGLPSEQAVRIVDTYFPGHRESFLGVPVPGPWLPPEEYFDATRSTIFNHEWSLAGRQDELDQLVSAAYQPDASLTFVTGAGGMGKSRLLKALADAAPPATQVRIQSGDAQVSAADFELLPHEGNLTVLIDDAHELTEVTGIVAGIWRRNRNAKVVLATRPYGLQTLKAGLARHGLLPMPHTQVELEDLDIDDAIALGREAVGGKAPEAVVRRLAALTTDSPLATVVGGVLIRQGQLEPGALEQDDDVRFHIMRGFRDALVNDPLAYDPPTRRAVLDALAALQPFRTNEATARESLSEIVGRPYDELHKHLRSLENAGILRRRGESLRIVPDLLGDVVLTEAAFDGANPLGTGYLARIEPMVTGSGAEHLFINVSRVDWQVRNKHDGAPSLADSLWAAFRGRIEAADMIDRRTLAETLAKVAYFQPERALEATRWLIDNPTDRLDGEHAAWRAFLATDYSSVLQALPAVLKFAAMDPDTLPEALNQLWELAQRDERPTNQHPEHALRVLCGLAEFGVTKPIWFHDQIVDVASTWFADGQRLSPFDVLEPMLATEGQDSTFRDHTITFQPYSLNPQTIMRVRQRVIDLAFEELGSPDLRRAGAAANFLKSALRYPTGLFGRPVSSSERDGWTPGFVQTIERLGAVAAAGGLDPAVLVSIREALYWNENYGDGPTHDAAVRVVESLPGGVEHLLALTVHDGWGHLLRDRSDSFEAVEAKRLGLIQAVVDGLTGLTDREVIDLIVARLRADREVHGPTDGHPGPVVAGLINARPTLAHTVLDNLRTTPVPNDLDPVLPVILGTFAEQDPAAALTDIKELLASAPEDRRRAVSQAIGWNRGPRELHAGELDLLLQLAADPDVVIRRNVARAAQLLARTHTAEATRLLAALRFGDDESLADNIFACFRLDLGISWSNFSDPELELVRQDLLTLPGIGGYSVSGALATRSAIAPGWVIGLLQDRVQLAESLNPVRGYEALPHSWDNQLQIRDTPDFLPSLNGILAWVAEDLGSWPRRTMGADLFAAVANGYDTEVVELLANALAFGTAETTLAVAAVLRQAPRTFIWDRPDFVRTALHAADRLGEHVLRDMIGALWGATISGMRSGTPGEPFPETVQQRDKSRDIARDLPTGSIEKKFYSDMAKSADRDILRDIDDDLSTDGRAW
ncbi:helix-turn-helix domain-containing protein [Terrabacter sp. Soil811]|uniref:helix-turn-helix domain-containing protein n=1 Tax=Terrabacter sp. Soil811 TaxID=1736419 RepID=UPI0012E33A88|nr:helix-turn-helix domain-containing protein [Terrabacter sp. Soil811]